MIFGLQLIFLSQPPQITCIFVLIFKEQNGGANSIASLAMINLNG